MRAYFVLLLFILVGCTPSENPHYVIDERYTAVQVSPRIEFIVLHFTHLDFDDSLRALTKGKVSSHYLVPQQPINGKPVIYRLVDDDLKAAHAGLSYWQGQYSYGQINLNASSIGIEIVHLGYKDDARGRYWYPYTDHQIDLTIALLKDLVVKYDIKPTAIIGHGEITPNVAARGNNKRIDPGPLFPWEKLAAAGLGAWYDPDAVAEIIKKNGEKEIDLLSLQKNLATYGYNIKPTGELDEQTREVIVAFQMHFRPSNYSGIPDQETYAIIENLVNKYFSGKKLQEDEQTPADLPQGLQ